MAPGVSNQLKLLGYPDIKPKPEIYILWSCLLPVFFSLLVFSVGGHGDRDGRRVSRGNRCRALCCRGDDVDRRTGRLAGRPGAGR